MKRSVFLRKTTGTMSIKDEDMEEINKLRTGEFAGKIEIEDFYNRHVVISCNRI